ncbi:sigma-54-dependent transcriptional regulator [Candidatus Latescibacterota bacterium]
MSKNNSQKILVVDNDKSISWVLTKALSEEGYLVDVAMDGKTALDMIAETRYTVIIMDVMMPVMDGLTALKHIRELPDRPETIMITAHSSMESTVEAMKHGAFDYVIKPFDIDEVIDLAARAVERYENRTLSKPGPDAVGTERIIGDSPPMHELYKLLGRLASTDSSVLITGETGTGKDLFARAIHYHSSRRDKPFVMVNCASIPGELLESELFGHVKGAFTGATGLRKGKCEIADGGTLFLDEIGAMRLDLQAKLLTFLQRSEFERVGSSSTITVDVRVIAASNADLKSLTAENQFREDLYYRLKVVPLHIPPLRERKGDIRLLIKYFVGRFTTKYGIDFSMTEDFITSLVDRSWAGNVRELENTIHRMVVLQPERPEYEDTPSLTVPERPETESIDAVVTRLMSSGRDNILDDAHESIEEPLLRRVMSHVGGNQSEAAKKLGVSRNTLRKMLTRYDLLP